MPAGWPPWRLTAGSTARRRRRRVCGRCKSMPSPPAPSRLSLPHSTVTSRCAASWLRPRPLRRGDCSRFTSTGHLHRAQARRTRQERVAERKVFVQLLDAGGQLVAQDDRPLVLSAPRAAGSGLAVYGLVLPAELGAGPYQLIAGIYDPAAGGCAPAEDQGRRRPRYAAQLRLNRRNAEFAPGERTRRAYVQDRHGTLTGPVAYNNGSVRPSADCAPGTQIVGEYAAPGRCVPSVASLMRLRVLPSVLAIVLLSIVLVVVLGAWRRGAAALNVARSSAARLELAPHPR